jgi:hypothetical protein
LGDTAPERAQRSDDYQQPSASVELMKAAACGTVAGTNGKLKDDRKSVHW